MTEPMTTPLQPLLNLEVPLIVQIAEKTATVAEIERLAPGAIIAFPKSVAEDLTILVNKSPIGQGSAVKVGENFGVRVNSVEPASQRLQALGR